MPPATSWWVPRRSMSIGGSSGPTPCSATAARSSARRCTRIQGCAPSRTGDDILVVSFKTKAHSISPDVLDGLNRAIDIAEERFKGMVVWQSEAPFSVGANLESLRPALAAGDWQGVEGIIALFQKTSMHLRYSADSDGRGDAGVRIRRRMRVRDALRSSGRGSRVVRGPGGGGRRTAAGRRRLQGARAARGRREQGRSLRIAQGLLHADRDGQGGRSGIEAQELGLSARRAMSSCSIPASSSTSPSSRRSRCTMPAIVRRCAGGRFPVAGRSRRRLDQGTARQHAGGAFHQRI